MGREPFGSGADGEGDAGDAGVVVLDAEVVPGVEVRGGEEGGEVVGLAEAELEGEEAAGTEGGVGCGDEAAVDLKAGGAAEEGEVGLVVHDLGLEGGGLVDGDVRGVGDDDVEGRGGFELRGFEEIGGDEVDAVAEVEATGVVLGDGEGGGGEVGCGDVGGGQFGGEGESNGSGAGADVQDSEGDAGSGEVWPGGDPVEDGFDEELGFGAGDEGVAGDAEREAVELLHAGEVLEGFFGGAAGGESAEGGEEVGGKVGVGVGEEPGAVAEEEVDEEGFGVAAGDAGGGFGDGFAESHKAGDRG